MVVGPHMAVGVVTEEVIPSFSSLSVMLQGSTIENCSPKLQPVLLQAVAQRRPSCTENHHSNIHPHVIFSRHVFA